MGRGKGMRLGWWWTLHSVQCNVFAAQCNVFAGCSLPGPVVGAENAAMGEPTVSRTVGGRREPLQSALRECLLLLPQPWSRGSGPVWSVLHLTAG